MSKKTSKQRSSGHINFRFYNAQEVLTVPAILSADLEGTEFDKHDINMPVEELAASFAETYEYVAEEFGKNVPGTKRGLRAGDWLLIHQQSPNGQPPWVLKCLIASWRFKTALEPHCTGIAWTEKMENAIYILKPNYQQSYGSPT